MSSKENIRVVCRIRPENKIEKDGEYNNCMTYNSSSIKININNDSEKRSNDDCIQDFTFDKIFGPDSKQSAVFEYSALPIIQSVMEGYNGTIMCYGQTSSGKTYTMEGINTDIEKIGIIPRMIDSVFDHINNSSEDIEFSVKCSYIEIYNEKIQDLLDRNKYIFITARKTNLLVKEEKEKGTWVQDCTEIFVGCSEEIKEVYKIGTNNRMIAATEMNKRSSRSHSIFLLTVFQRNNKTESTRNGKLFLVDMAGSEKQKKNKGKIIEESKNINRSLLYLGYVVKSLSEGKGNHIPYRESKLTRILQDSLGGNCLTSLIATCSMSSLNEKESLSTLRFANRANNIKNTPIINTEKSCKELTSKLNYAQEKIKNFENIIQELQFQLENLNRGGGKLITSSSYVNTTNSSSLGSSRCEDCGNAMVKILNQHIEIVGLVDDVEKLKVEKNELDNEIKIRNEEIYDQNERLLLNDMQTRNYIEEESKNLKEIQSKFENSFVINQKKIIETSNLRNSIEKIKFELNFMKANQTKSINKDRYDLIEIENQTINKINIILEQASDILIKLDSYIYINNCLLNEANDLNSKKTGLFEYLPNKSIWDISSTNNVKVNKREISHRSFIYPNSKRSINNIDQNLINNQSNGLKKSKSFSYLIKLEDKEDKKKISLEEDISDLNIEYKAADSNNLKSDFKFKIKLDLSKISLDEIKTKDKDLITSQRKTMLELSLQLKNMQENFSSLQKEIEEKDSFIKINNEKNQNLIKEYEQRLKNYELELSIQEKQFTDYRDKTLKDFSFKESQILELHNKISFLENEKFRLMHLDKDKKKFNAMEVQINQLANEMQKLLQENLKIKQLIEKKDEELKILNEKYSSFEKQLFESGKTNLKGIDVISFNKYNNARDCKIGTLTPIIKPSRSCSFHFETLNEILSKKLNSIKNKNGSINSSIHNVNEKINSPITTLKTNKMMKIVKGKGGLNIFKIVTVPNGSSNLINSNSDINEGISDPNNIKAFTPVIQNDNNKNNLKFNYSNYNSINTVNNQAITNGFYSKMLNNTKDLNRNREYVSRLSLNFNQNVKNDKLNQEMKLLEEDYGDEINNLYKDPINHKQYILPQKIVINGKNNNVNFMSLITQSLFKNK